MGIKRRRNNPDQMLMVDITRQQLMQKFLEMLHDEGLVSDGEKAAVQLRINEWPMAYREYIGL